jgi:parallel beta-helix repeat protein
MELIEISSEPKSKGDDLKKSTSKIFLLIGVAAIVIIGVSLWATFEVGEHDPSDDTPIINQTAYGTISHDEIWEGEFYVIGDVIVEEGVTLTIAPGTFVEIAANSDAQNLITEEVEMRQGIQNESDNSFGVHMGEPWRDEGNHISIMIRGTLQAIGTQDERITITSDSPTPGIYDWNRFQFAHGSLSYVNMSYYRILSPGDDTTVSNNILTNIGECGIGNTSGMIEYNAISNAGHELIDLHGASPVIRHNELGPNPGKVGIIVDGGAPSISDNIIVGCDIGIAFLAPDNATLIDNIFFSNREDIVYDY